MKRNIARHCAIVGAMCTLVLAAACICGLPMVMNYAVPYDFAIDKNFGQCKAPLNAMFNDRCARPADSNDAAKARPAVEFDDSTAIAPTASAVVRLPHQRHEGHREHVVLVQ